MKGKIIRLTLKALKERYQDIARISSSSGSYGKHWIDYGLNVFDAAWTLRELESKLEKHKRQVKQELSSISCN